MKPPTPSIASAISLDDGRRLVPLKKRCSMKCETFVLQPRTAAEHEHEAGRLPLGHRLDDQPGSPPQLMD
jgi:hypothetical protein